MGEEKYKEYGGELVDQYDGKEEVLDTGGLFSDDDKGKKRKRENGNKQPPK